MLGLAWQAGQALTAEVKRSRFILILDSYFIVMYLYFSLLILLYSILYVLPSW